MDDGRTGPDPEVKGRIARAALVTTMARPGPRLTLLDAFLVASAVVALVALVGWWAFLADSPNPSGPLQPL